MSYVYHLVQRSNCLNEVKQQIPFLCTLRRCGPRYTECKSCRNMYRYMLHCGLILPYILVMSVYWRQWCSSGVCTIGDLYKNGQFMSYEELSRQFKLEGKQHFWKYLQIRDCVKSRIGNCSKNYILEYLNAPREPCKASQL